MGRGGKAVAGIVALAVIVVVVLFGTGMLQLESTGGLRAPNVEVSGGDVPQVALKTGSIKVSSDQATVDVPRIAVDRDQLEVNVPTIDIETSNDEG